MLSKAGAIAVLLVIAVIAGAGVFRDGPYSPAQPIAFSHKIHAGDNEIACQYCHTYARRSTVAGIPSVQLCMGCHRNVAQESPQVQKLSAYWERQASIPWTRVYDMPDFVYFSHKRHVRADVACQECHGPVETMSVVEKSGKLDMARCVSCHRQQSASVDCLTCHK